MISRDNKGQLLAGTSEWLHLGQGVSSWQVGAELHSSDSPSMLPQQLGGSLPPAFSLKCLRNHSPAILLYIRVQQGRRAFLLCKNTIPVEPTTAPALCKSHGSDGFQHGAVSAVPEWHWSTAMEAALAVPVLTRWLVRWAPDDRHEARLFPFKSRPALTAQSNKRNVPNEDAGKCRVSFPYTARSIFEFPTWRRDACELKWALLLWC